MGIAHDATSKVGRALGKMRAGSEKLMPCKLGVEGAPPLEVKSDDFVPGAMLPRKSTIDGAGTPPEIEWSKPPPGTKSIAIVLEDADAPLPEPFVHWLVYGIPPEQTTLLPGTLGGARQGENSKMKRGFTPAAPPPGHGVHDYHFQVFALDTEITLDDGAGRSALLGAMRDHVIAWGDLVGRYERQ